MSVGSRAWRELTGDLGRRRVAAHLRCSRPLQKRSLPMRLTIELTPGQEEQLQHAAQAEGLDLATLAQKLVTEHLPAVPVTSPDSSSPVISEKNRAAIAMLQAWIAEDATDDPEEIRRAEEE